MKKVECLNCGYKFTPKIRYCDDLGDFAVCPECHNSFDIQVIRGDKRSDFIIKYNHLNVFSDEEYCVVIEVKPTLKQKVKVLSNLGFRMRPSDLSFLAFVKIENEMFKYFGLSVYSESYGEMDIDEILTPGQKEILRQFIIDFNMFKNQLENGRKR